MAPPRKHDTDVILDAARTLVLRDGPRAASVAAIAAASGAPVGTLYHRFGNRNGVLVETWIRALDRFQRRAMAAGDEPDPLDAAVGMAAATIEFGRELPEDAQLLLQLRPGDLLDGAPDTELRARLDRMNAPLIERMHVLTEQLYQADDEQTVNRVVLAVVDLPYAALRRHARAGKIPAWLAAEVADATRTLLTAR
ncbi:TetR family transcriptional regulator [Nocardia sp. CDC159]|uniref:TetR family transcriptional regulator n=1 Tax=Nocardia pulmonis TaxID=2951408 RepID=A0A9X2J141_9NOCA|nr:MULTISPECIES: TetR family transcriptional regulator [Nocardia]MCM6778494.1 TetR family transcriptional regulator [Nocardia pulmonis]MCM6791383.1 TetR family transcriptional regulator [Nocardia sp. CDC159]